MLTSNLQTPYPAMFEPIKRVVSRDQVTTPPYTIDNAESFGNVDVDADANADDDAMMTDASGDETNTEQWAGLAASKTATNLTATAMARIDSSDSSVGSGSGSSSAASGGSGSNRAGSSQTSSRDWGWFEDVHMQPESLSTPYLKRKDNASSGDKNGKKRGKKGNTLVPHSGDDDDDNTSSQNFTEILARTSNPDTDASAMAVTAPTYVLEESLSSQLLWKDTAGTRPPQPFEERAFFEKMWAQNFARSQVEYRMPVEVLTATTPIFLSPFADGNFDDTARGTDMSDYSIATSDNPSKKQNAAEATLISRLNDPRHNENSSKFMEPHNYQHMVVNKKVKDTGGGDELTVLVRGDNVFGTTVSKSFAKSSDKGGPIVGVDTVNISIASYRVVESKKHGKYAQFLVIYREGSIRDIIGVWKRYSDFVELSKQVTQAHEGCAAVIANMSPLAMTEEHDVEHLPNAITSWRLLKKRQRWYRCLDAGYLSLKVFLLERFLHDILFESSNPNLLRDFVGAHKVDG